MNGHRKQTQGVAMPLALFLFVSSCDTSTETFSTVESESRFRTEVEIAKEHGINITASKGGNDIFATYDPEFFFTRHKFFKSSSTITVSPATETPSPETLEAFFTTLNWETLPPTSRAAKNSVYRICFFKANDALYVFVDLTSRNWFVEHYESFLEFNEYSTKPIVGGPVWLLGKTRTSELIDVTNLTLNNVFWFAR